MSIYPWQMNNWQVMEQRLTSGRLPHAMLFSGPQGIGKADFANHVVYHLFCQNKQNNKACGNCNACHLLNVNNHPDLLRISRLEDKKDISVDQIRELINYSNFKAHSASKKIVIIEHAEHMNIAASNSLLKTLEEAPDSCIIILLTHRSDKLLPTIRSRCQLQQFSVPDQETALSWLKTTLDDKDNAEKLLALANGAPLTALIYEKSELLAQRDDMFTALVELTKGQQNPINVAKQWLKLDLDMTLYCMTSWVTDMVRLKATQQPPVVGNPDLKAALLTISQKSALPQLLDYYELVNKLAQWKQANINTQLLLEEMLVRWSQLNQPSVTLSRGN